MKKILISAVLLSALLIPAQSFSAVWKPLGKMNMGGMKVTIYVDKSSIQANENNPEFKRAWVKFDLPKNVKSDYSNDLYRSREELYYFHCGQNLYTVSHLILFNSEDEMVYDSGEFDPFTEDFDKAWKLITPASGPDLVNTYVCKLDHSKIQDDDVPEWMRKSKTEALESPSLSKNLTGGETALKEIRWAMRDDGVERLVFDIYEGEVKVTKPDNYKVIDEARDQKFDIRLKGYRSVDTVLPGLEKSEIIKEIIVSKDEENSAVNVEIKFNNSPEYNVFEVENPGRVVIDLTPQGENP